MNLAILIGVSDYRNPENNLPTCRNDVVIMNEVLASAQKYNDILFIETDTESFSVKEKITSFISSYSGNNIEELFFYFTGHGEYFEDEFYYILSDFDPRKRKQTTLENTELDNLIKSLNPNLTIKVVDACNAGTQYVKDMDGINEYIKGTANQYNKCYFMFSSQTDQYSYQDTRLSFFTRGFLDAINNHQSNEIRYKSIIDFVSDYFQNNSKQTPLFITQANFTEKFCNISEEMKSILRHNSDKIAVSGKKGQSHTLEELIKMDAEAYCTKQETMSILEQIFEFVTTYQFGIENLYNVEVAPLPFEYIPKKEAIGEWLKTNKNNYFAKVNEINYSILDGSEVSPAKLASQMSSALLGAIDFSRHFIRRKVSGFQTTVSTDYHAIEISSIPKYPNIDKYSCVITFVISLTHIRFFYFHSKYKRLDWESVELVKNFGWSTKEAKLKDSSEINQILSGVLGEFIDGIINELNSRFRQVESLDIE